MTKMNLSEEDKKIIKIFRLEEIIDLLIEYDIKHFDLDTEKLFGVYLMGYTDIYDKEIAIYSNLSKKDSRKTIIHEFIHALKDKYNIRDREKDTERQGNIIYETLFKNYVSNLYLIGEKHDKKTGI